MLDLLQFCPKLHVLNRNALLMTFIFKVNTTNISQYKLNNLIFSLVSELINRKCAKLSSREHLSWRKGKPWSDSLFWGLRGFTSSLFGWLRRKMVETQGVVGHYFQRCQKCLTLSRLKVECHALLTNNTCLTRLWKSPATTQILSCNAHLCIFHQHLHSPENLRDFTLPLSILLWPSLL